MAVEQPTPSQWEFATRNWDQPQPFFAKQLLAPAAAAAQPVKTFFVAEQRPPEQPQPQVWRQQLDLVAMSPGQGTFSPAQDPFQPQPWFAKRFFAPAAAAAQPTGQWFARGQDDPTQAQPEFWQAAPGNLAPKPSQFFATRQDDPSQRQPWFAKAFFAPAVAAPKPTGQWFVPAQADSSQVQPQVWRQQLTSAVAAKPFGQWFVPQQQAQDQTQPNYSRGQFANVAPATVQWFVPPQADPTQVQPTYKGQFPPSQATERPATRPWFARPQDDPTQLAPVVFTPGASQIPSQPTPPPVPEDGGASGLGDYASTVVAKRRQAELTQQLTRQRQAAEVAAEAVAERERSLVRARSEKTKERERARLAKAQAQQAEQARLVDLIAQELAALTQAGRTGILPVGPDPYQSDEEDALILLLLA